MKVYFRITVINYAGYVKALSTSKLVLGGLENNVSACIQLLFEAIENLFISSVRLRTFGAQQN